MLYRGHARNCLFFLFINQSFPLELDSGSCETSNDGFSSQRRGRSWSPNQQLGGARLNPQDV